MKQARAEFGGIEVETTDDVRSLRDALAGLTYPAGLADEAETAIAGFDDAIEQLEDLEPGSPEFDRVMNADDQNADARDASDQIISFGTEECYPSN